MEENIDILVKELCKLPKETGWVEFKHNNDDPIMIGEDVSALANTATLKDRDFAYMIWGVDDTTHEIEGTTVCLSMRKKGQEERHEKGGAKTHDVYGNLHLPIRPIRPIRRRSAAPRRPGLPW